MAEVKGMDGLLRKLDGMPYSVAKRAIARALRKGAEPIREEAARLAPRDDDPTHGGHAADTMMISVQDQSAIGAVAKIGASKAGFYLGQQETGNINHPAQAHLRPALDAKQREAEEILGNELARQIERAMGAL